MVMVIVSELLRTEVDVQMVSNRGHMTEPHVFVCDTLRFVVCVQ